MPRLGGALDIVQVADPATPTAGRQALYFKSDGLLYTKKSDGTIVQVGSDAAPTNMVTTDTVQTITGLKTFTSGVQAPSVITNGNTLPSAYPMGFSTVTMSTSRTGTPNWPGGSKPGIVSTIKTSDTVYQIFVTDTYQRIRQSATLSDTWNSWYTLVDGYAWTAKGSLAVGPLNSDGAPQPLPVGSNGQVLTADSLSSVGVKWATPSGGSGDTASNVVTSANTTAAKLTTSINASPPLSPTTGDMWLVSDVNTTSLPAVTTPSGIDFLLMGA